MIKRLFVPNRGEIAIRIARTCREMGVHTILGHSAEDGTSRAARYFDELVSLGEGESRDTYLNIGKIIDAARHAKADALHPGFGFLSERAELAEACADAGIIFVGPKAHSIAAMGSKSESRRLMQSLGVPVVPGYDGNDQSLDTLLSEGKRVGFPLLVKASAGGGGKGMRVVRAENELRGAIEAAQREAEKSFGNPQLLLERYIEEPRHVEFQIFGDAHGTIVHMFERDCSVQRRHQKVIEESPAPNYPDELRQRMAKAAVAAAAGVQYENAGTVEFIVTPEGEFYFLEMNTRLQVEHPVTEQVIGMDLVRLQLRVASGERFDFAQSDLNQRGHAIECRIYAEDPDHNFLPQIGRVAAYREPSGPGVRVDSGIEAGTEISVRYDPMLAKLIVSAADRTTCVDRLLRALDEYVILGTTTNLPFLRRVVAHPTFREGRATTAFLGRDAASLQRSVREESAAIGALLASSAKRTPARLNSGDSESAMPSVWEQLGGWGRT